MTPPGNSETTATTASSRRWTTCRSMTKKSVKISFSAKQKKTETENKIKVRPYISAYSLWRKCQGVGNNNLIMFYKLRLDLWEFALLNKRKHKCVKNLKLTSAQKFSLQMLTAFNLEVRWRGIYRKQWVEKRKCYVNTGYLILKSHFINNM